MHVQNLKRTLDGQRRAIGTVLTNAQRLIDTEEGSPQQIQRLKCNTTDLRIRFDEVTSFRNPITANQTEFFKNKMIIYVPRFKIKTRLTSLILNIFFEFDKTEVF